MTLAITADATDYADGYVTLSVTGAVGSLPIGSPIYIADWTGTWDSWTTGTDGAAPAPGNGYLVSNDPLPGYLSEVSSDWYDEDQYVARTVTGLTIGHVYKFETTLRVYSSTATVLLYLGVDTIGHASPTPVTSTFVTLSYTFTATATSHSLRIRRTDGTARAIRLRAATLQRMSTNSEAAMVILRYDANGTQFVRLEADQAPDSSGALSVQDWEAACFGVTYLVRDVSGATASTAEIDPYDVSYALAPTTTYPVNLVAVGYEQATGCNRVEEMDQRYEYRESGNSLAIIGRGDPIISTRADNNWTKRSGSIALHAETQFDADAIVSVIRAARVTFLRTTADLRDMYLVATAVEVVPQVLGVDGWAYTVRVEYQEVGCPEGPLQGNAAWTYDDITNGDLIAYFELLGEYATYADLAAG